MATQILDLEKFLSQPLTTEPFPFMVVTDFLRHDQIKALSRDFPAMKNAGLYPADVLDLGPAMQQLVDELSGEDFRHAVETKFGLDLQGRPPMVTIRGFARHKDGRIHADSDNKVVSLLLYLNEEWPHDGGQLRFLRDPNDLESTIVQITPLAGTLAIFKVTPNGWHGHNKFVGERRVVMLNYMVSEEVRQSELKRHRFSAKVKNFKNLVGVS